MERFPKQRDLSLALTGGRSRGRGRSTQPYSGGAVRLCGLISCGLLLLAGGLYLAFIRPAGSSAGAAAELAAAQAAAVASGALRPESAAESGVSAGLAAGAAPAASAPSAAAASGGEIPQFAAPSLLSPHDGAIDGVDSAPRIASDGAGVWLAVWEAAAPLGDGPRRDTDIALVRSEDNGETWSEPVALNRNAADDSGNDAAPAILGDSRGTWLAAWTSNEDLDQALGADRDIFVARSEDAGRTWTDPRPLNANASGDWGDDDRVSLATDGKGAWMAVWQSTDSLMNTVGGDSDILFAVSGDGGETWSEPAVLNSNAAGDAGADMSPALATDGAGTWIVAWSSDDALAGNAGHDRDIVFAVSHDLGATWTEPATIASYAAEDDRPDEDPYLAVGAGGRWICTWSSAATLGETLAMDRDILVARSEDSGASWSAAAPLNNNAATDAGDDSGVRLAGDGRGGWLAVWQSWDRITEPIGADADILMAYSADGGRAWSDPSPVDANAATDVGEDTLADIAADGKGRWVAVWRSTEPGVGASGNDPDILAAVSSKLSVPLKSSVKSLR